MLELKIESLEDDKKFHVDRITVLRKVFETVLDMTTEVDILVTNDGLKIQAIDNMQIMYADILISKKVFSSFRCDRNLVLGVKSNIFLNVLKSVKVENLKYFLLTCEDEAKELSIIIENEDCTISRKLVLFNFENETFNIPNLEYNVTIQMTANFFTFIQKSVSDFPGDYLKFNTTKEKINLSVKGEIISSNIKIRALDKNNNKNIELECLEESEKIIPIKFLNYITKCSSLADKVIIKFSGNTPIFFNFNMSDYGFAKFYIAPKEEDNEDEE